MSVTRFTLTPSDPLNVRVHTSDARVYGRAHHARGISTARTLNNDDRPHVPITDATIYTQGLEHPPEPTTLAYTTHFVAIPKRNIHWLAGGHPDPNSTHLGLYPRPIHVLYPTS